MKALIGVIGSAEDLKYTKKTEKVAEELGRLIASKGYVLVYGAEKDYSSLGTIACISAKKAGGLTIGITYGKNKNIVAKEYTDIVIPTGMERGGGREFPLVLMCDVIIAVAGGSGTLTEIAMAYQANIPVIALTCCNGWAKKLANKFLDGRKRSKIIKATNAKEAVDIATMIIRNKR